MLVMMELIILVILEVHANDHTRLSSSNLTPLATSLHPFQLDNGNITHIHHCLETTIEECLKKLYKMMCIGNLLFEDLMHHKDNPLNLYNIRLECIYQCRLEFKDDFLRYAACLVNYYERHIEND